MYFFKGSMYFRHTTSAVLIRTISYTSSTYSAGNLRPGPGGRGLGLRPAGWIRPSPCQAAGPVGRFIKQHDLYTITKDLGPGPASTSRPSPQT